MNNIKWIENWYSSVCNGEWEEYYGVRITTIDNPGWLVEVDLLETDFEKRKFYTINTDNNEQDWICCKVENGKFIGAGDINKLSKILSYFRDWIEKVELAESHQQ